MRHDSPPRLQSAKEAYVRAYIRTAQVLLRKLLEDADLWYKHPWDSPNAVMLAEAEEFANRIDLKSKKASRMIRCAIRECDERAWSDRLTRRGSAG